MRSYRATHNLLAVSAYAQETAINTEQTLDLSLLCAIGDVINRQPRRETNVDELNGKEEADEIYDLGGLSSVSLNFAKAQPQHIAFLAAYALGNIVSAAAGDGYIHTITPIEGDLDDHRSVPSFTGGQRLGKTVLKRLFASMFADSLNITFAKDQWLQARAEIRGTGKVTTNVVEESLTAAPNAVSLTLAANGVEGTTAGARLDNVQRIRVELASGVWTEVSYSAVSAATPAVITIAAPSAGAGDPVTYKILYVPTEAAWCSFPARVSETPLRISQLTAKMGGAWSGSAFVGGRALTSEINSIEWAYQNNLAIEFTPGAGGAYASRAFRDSRTQTLRLDRDFREYILQQHIDDNDYFGVYALCEGALYDETHRYQVEVVWPRCGVIAAPVTVNGRRLAEAGDLAVLEDDTYGSVILRVKNLQATYAA